MNSLISVTDCDDVEVEEFTGDVEPGTVTRKGGKKYQWHSEYLDEDSARDCITADDGFEGYFWRCQKVTANARGSTHWYRCVESIKCPMVQMKIDTIEELAVVLVGIGEHDHTKSSEDGGTTYGIDPRIKPLIDDFERLGVKPATMLISLREKATYLPTVSQLNNYLKRLRNIRTGNLGSRFSLNDILAFFNEHKEVPEDIDQMYVVDCYCDASTINNELEFKFRIFLTTKRLIQFTEYVTVIANVIVIER